MAGAHTKKFVFVLMPFQEDFEDIYKLGIKSACNAAGAYCERVDEQIFHENIMDRIYNQILKADLIVADMSGRNPNVFYETGYAHGLNKKVILLTKDEKDIPFDLKHYPHIIYGGKISKLRDELERRLTWYLAQPEKDLFDIRSLLQYLVDGQPLVSGEGFVFLRQKYRVLEGYTFNMTLSIHNSTDKVIDTSRVRCALVFDDTQQHLSREGLTLMPDDKLMWKISDLGRDIFPDEWRTVSSTIDVYPGHQERLGYVNIPTTLRIFSEGGTRDIPFILRCDLR